MSDPPLSDPSVVNPAALLAARAEFDDIAAQSRWWAETLGYVVVWDSPEGVAIVPPWASTTPLEDPEEWRRQPQGMVFVPVEEGKEVKNRLHLDLAPHTTGDRDAEIEALLGRGAARADVGQPADAGSSTRPWAWIR